MTPKIQTSLSRRADGQIDGHTDGDGKNNMSPKRFQRPDNKVSHYQSNNYLINKLIN
jgi:hypothetical protein